jgi:hypothetical protein
MYSWLHRTILPSHFVMQAPTAATALLSAAGDLDLAATIDHVYFFLMTSKVKVEACEGCRSAVHGARLPAVLAVVFSASGWSALQFATTCS